MNNTTTDYLYALSSQAPDRSYSAPSSDDDGSAFGDHLSQAANDSNRSNSTGPSRSDSTNASGVSNDSNSSDNEDSQSPVAPLQLSRPHQDNSTSDLHRSSDESHSHQASSARHDSHKQRDADKSKRDKSQDASAQAAGQAATANSQPVSADKSDEATISEQAKAQSATEQAAADSKPQTGQLPPGANTKAPQVQTAEAGQSIDATKLATESAKPAESAATDATENNSDGSTLTADAKAHALSAKAKAEQAAKSPETNENKPEPTSTQTNDSTVDAVQNSTSDLPATANVATSVLAKRGSDDVSASGEAHHTPHDEDQAETTVDSAAGANKLDIVTVGNVVTNVADASPNTPAKSIVNDQTVKPVTAKATPTVTALDRLTRFSNGLSQSDSTDESDDGSRIDISRFVSRVAKAFQTAQDRDGTLQLRLSPPDLGSMKLELTVKDGVMSASMQTETASARKLLLDHLPTLRDRLAEQNIRVDRFDVDVRRDGTGGQSDTRGWQQQQSNQQSGQPAPRRPTQTLQPQSSVATSAEPAAAAVATVSDAGLNLVV
jgi:flagellar hook-length control protein FliK